MTAALVASGLITTAHAQFNVAGTNYVDLRATNSTAGGATWNNQGTLGSFARTGAPSLVPNVNGSGIPGVLFNGTTDWYLGPASVGDLESNSDRSIEVWVLNPAVATEETLVAWAHRGSNGQNMSMNYGASSGSAGFGAAGHWGSAFDVGWATAAPVANTWHHIVYTYAGTTCNIYVDGVLNTSKAVGTLNSFAGFTIVVGGQHINSSPFTGVDTAQLLSGYINAVRVHGGTLSGADIDANYRLGPWAATPTGRWTADANGNWSDTTKWDGGVLPFGNADFSTIDITSDRVVTLDTARTVSAVRFGDTSGSQNWTLTGANTLTLAAASPLIAVNQNTGTVNVVVAGTTGLSKTGGGTLVLNRINTYSGSTFVKAGTLVVDAGGAYSSSSFNSIGQSGTENGTLVVHGGVTVNADFNVSDINSSVGTVIVQGTGTVAVSTLYVGKANTTTGTVNQTSGIVQRSTGGGDWRIGGGNSSSDVASLGTYNLSGGVLLPNGNLQIGAFGNGTLNQSGGSVNFAAGFPVIGRFVGSVGNLNLTGGAFTQAVAGNFLIVGEQGNGTLSVSNAGLLVVQGTTGLRLAHAAGSTGAVNLGGGGSGGMIIAPAVSTASGSSSTFNFNGGTLRASANSGTFLQGLTAANVRSGGAVIDDGGFAITVAQNLADGGGGGGLTKLGAGTLTLSANNGFTGPTTIDAGTLRMGAGGTTGTLGVNTGPVTNNGTLQFNRSDSFNWDRPITGSGRVVKTNNNVLTLTSAHSYSGDTLVGAGTLALGAAASIPNSAQIIVGGGATFDVSAVSGFALNTVHGQILGGSGVVTGNVTAASGTQLIPGTSAGTLSLSNDLTLTGGVTNRFELANTTTEGSGINDEIIVAGNLSVSGVNTMLITPTALDLSNGRYKLIRYGGTLSGGAANFTVVFTTPLPQVVAFVDDSIPGEIDLVVGHRLNFSQPAVTNIEATMAVFGVRVTDDGGVGVTSWGAAYGLTPAPVANLTVGSTPTGAPLDITPTLTGLTPGMLYYARGWASNGVEGRVYSSETNFYTEPLAASGLSFLNVSNRTMTISWTADPSSGGSVVLVRQGIPVAFVPVDGASYNGNSFFGAGTDLGGGTYVVFAGSAASVDLRELNKNTTYYVAVYSYSGVGAQINYQQDGPATGSQTTGNLAVNEAAGQLVIDLSVARGLQTTPDGAVSNWVNYGSVGGSFAVDGATDTHPAYGTVSNQQAVSFDGGDRLKATFAAPPQITGTNGYSVEYWVLNPEIANEEWLFTWARRGTSPRYAAFGYGSNSLFGFTAHWATPDMAFGEGISTPGLASTPAAGAWHHVVVTYDGVTERGYVDGVLNAQEAKALNVWDGDPVTMGQSYSIPFAYATTIPYSGALASLRVHTGVLTAGQITDNYGNGPSPSVAPYFALAPQSVTVGECGTATFGMVIAGSQPVAVQWYVNGSPAPDATNETFAVNNVQMVDNGAQFAVVASNSLGRITSPTATLAVVNAAASLTHRYSFTTDATDSVAGANGTLFGNANISGGQLNLDGTTGTYADLPGGLINNYSNVTVEFWASFGVNPNWSRVFDFGDTNSSAAGRRYIFFTPHSGAGDHRMSIADGDPGGTHEQVAAGAGTLDGRTNLHVACLWDTTSGVLRLYTNGVLDATAATTIPLSNVSNVLSWIGRSLYAADGWLNGSIDELRIYNSALSAGKVLQSFQQGIAAPLADGPAVITQQPQSMTVECTGNAMFAVTAVGQCGNPVTYQWFFGVNPITEATNSTLSVIGVSPASAGAYTVRVTSPSGSVTSAPALLTVVDTSPPDIVCPANIVLGTSGGGCSSNVTFNVSASDSCGMPMVACTPASGSSFALGTTTVNCTAHDGNGNTNTCAFSVTVDNDQPPDITCPSNLVITVPAGQTSAVTTFTASATNNCGMVNVVCVPASGSSFPAGPATPVTCTATDNAGNSNSCTFTVTVNRAPLAMANSVGAVENHFRALTAAKLLSNDTDEDGDRLVVSGVSATSTNGGTVQLMAGTITYSPATNFSGMDVFTYTISDSRGGIATADVLVTVRDEGDPSLNRVSLMVLPDGVVLLFAGVPGYTYTVQRSTDLVTWTTLGTATAEENGAAEFKDTSPPIGMAFYRTIHP